MTGHLRLTARAFSQASLTQTDMLLQAALLANTAPSSGKLPSSSEPCSALPQANVTWRVASLFRWTRCFVQASDAQAVKARSLGSGRRGQADMEPVSCRLSSGQHCALFSQAFLRLTWFLLLPKAFLGRRGARFRQTLLRLTGFFLQVDRNPMSASRLEHLRFYGVCLTSCVFVLFDVTSHRLLSLFSACQDQSCTQEVLQAISASQH